MKKKGMYGEQARIYDLIYSFKDYKKETKEIKELIKKNKKSKGKELLEVACGTGNHLQYLEKNFNSTGIDLNEGILKVARKKLSKSTKLSKENMINFNLNKEFDVVLCLFSSIGYVKTYQNLRKTINNFANHLKKGGIVIIQPWFTKKQYKVGNPYMTTYEGDDIKVSRLEMTEKKGNLSVINFHFLVAEKNKGVKHFTDKHELGMFEYSEISKIMKEAGLKTKFLKFDRGLFLGIKK